ncbi:MAG: hypothetical protein WCH21_12350 [Bacteroidota bacterium]|jgi:hypothetical protein
MKKVIVVIMSVLFISVAFTSCKGHERCAAYGKIHKIDTGKTFTDKTQKAI